MLVQAGWTDVWAARTSHQQTPNLLDGHGGLDGDHGLEAGDECAHERGVGGWELAGPDVVLFVAFLRGVPGVGNVNAEGVEVFGFTLPQQLSAKGAQVNAVRCGCRGEVVDAAGFDGVDHGVELPLTVLQQHGGAQ
ncbi:hypothetical protein ILP97_17440 [Amycolatopsis sp. H6(2020)]|nr:hypothetical protein [Amycolatopsis sp. H6(2020)]